MSDGEQLLSGRDFARRGGVTSGADTPSEVDQLPLAEATDSAGGGVGAGGPWGEEGAPAQRAQVAGSRYPTMPPPAYPPTLAPARQGAGTYVQPSAPRASGPPASAGPAPMVEPPPLSRSFVPRHAAPEVTVGSWRAVLAKMGFRVKPSEKESAAQRDVRAVSRQWVGPRTVAVVNPKGGALKTPVCMMCAAEFARCGGSGVLAWCNNVTRGSLAWRSEPTERSATVLDLLQHAEDLMTATARVADVAEYVRHQTEDKYDVLASAAHLLSNQQRITEEDFDSVWKVATKYYRLTFIDSGNEESAPNWTRMIDRADALIVPMANRRDHAEAAREMLLQLRQRDARSAALTRKAVVVVSEASPKNAAYTRELVAEFGTEEREVVMIPFDPGLGADWLRRDGLEEATRRAFLRTAAAVADRLPDTPSPLAH